VDPRLLVLTKSTVLLLAPPRTRISPLNVTVKGGGAAWAHADAADPTIRAPVARSNPTRFMLAPPIASLTAG